MAKLKKRHKTFIVEQLACFEPPSEIVGQLKKKFDLEVTQAQIAYYNPQNSQGSRELARKWRHLFDETRDQFISESSQIPIAHKNYRLKELQKIYRRLFDAGELTEACKVLEQAAKEMGGAYESGGAPVATNNSNRGMNLIQMINQKIAQKNLN